MSDTIQDKITPKIIGFTGKKFSGKTTASKFFEDKGFVKINFKDELIAEIKKYLPDLLKDISVHYNLDLNQLFEQKPPEIRHLLQNWGTELRRNQDQDYWVLQYADKAVDAKWSNNLIVTDDVRFLNEADCVRDLGGIIIKIIRTNLISEDIHSSETEMDKIKPDYVVEAGSVDELVDKMNKIYQYFYGDTEKK